ncbi:hypothetical protein AV545_07240 [Paenibacillus jamilae]|nr:hypothetical protein AV545_07240 [Paenibacillus jamilae]
MMAQSIINKKVGSDLNITKISIVFILVWSLTGCTSLESFEKGHVSQQSESTEKNVQAKPRPSLVNEQELKLKSKNDSSNKHPKPKTLKQFYELQYKYIVPSMEKEIKEFKRLVQETTKDESDYNLILTYLKGTYIKQTYQTDESTNDEIDRELLKIKKKFKSPLPIYADTSVLGGLRFLVLVRPIDESDSRYKKVLDSIRGDENEADLLQTLGDKYKKYVLDLYVEDYFGVYEDASITSINFDTNDTKDKMMVVLNQELQSTVLQHNRQVNDTNLIPDHRWHLIVLEDTDTSLPETIVLRINSKLFSQEEIALTRLMGRLY